MTASAIDLCGVSVSLAVGVRARHFTQEHVAIGIDFFDVNNGFAIGVSRWQSTIVSATAVVTHQIPVFVGGFG